MSNFKIGDKVKLIKLDSTETLFGLAGGMKAVGFEVDLKEDNLDATNNSVDIGIFTYSLDDFELVDKPQPKFKVGDKVRCVKESMAIGVEVGDVYTIKDPIYNYNHPEQPCKTPRVTLEEVNSTPSEYCFELVAEENCKQPPKNYRELTPDTLIDISIDGNEFEVPLGDLIHAQALIGVGNGKFGYLIYTALKEVLDEEEVIYNNHNYDCVDTTTEQDLLMKAYFIDKEKEAKEQAFKEFIEKQREEISKLEQVLSELEQKFATLDKS